MRIILFGGSFNPPHFGHLAAARAALRQLRADELYFVPCGKSAYAKELMPAARRLRMLREMIKGRKGMRVSPVETKRRGVSRTIDTVKAFGKKKPGAEIFVLIGADQVRELKGWKRIEELKQRAGLVVAPRQGFRITASAKKKYALKLLTMPLQNISSTEIRKSL